MTEDADRATSQDDRYLSAKDAYGAALERLARAYEADLDLRRDLLQDIHVALWRSLASFNGLCCLRTWVYRVAHNVGASHVASRRRARVTRLASLDELAEAPDTDNPEAAVSERLTVERLMAVIHGLKPPDRQVVLLYLEDLDAAAIGEITGLSPGAVANRIYRAKAVLARRFKQGVRHGD